MIAWVRPAIVALDDAHCETRMPLRRRTKNHLGSLYFGVMATGADVTCGLLAMHHIRKSGQKLQLSFKDFTIDFKKRVECDARLTCHEGERIAAQVEHAASTGDRVNVPCKVLFYAPAKLGDEVVAEATLTLSLRRPVRT
jgi:acyl-coenzyme A thioesterase PaaI-like protein